MSKNLLIPIKKELAGQAKQILRGAGLSLLKPKFFVIDTAKAGVELEAYQQVEQVGYDSISDLFSTPVWDTVRLTSDSYINDKGETVPRISLFFEIALCEVSNVRNIIKTSVAGRNGTIKEYMSDGDYSIKIRGVIASKYSNRPPIEKITSWSNVTKSPLALTVDSNFLNNFGIYSLVIENPIIKQREGARNVWDVELDCCSDTPFELTQDD